MRTNRPGSFPASGGQAGVLQRLLPRSHPVTDEKADEITIGTRVTFPYGGSRRTGTVADVSMMPNSTGGTTVAYLIDVGARKVFVQGDGVSLAVGGPVSFDAVQEGAAYGPKRPRNRRRR